ncbi:hypothetical protein KY342_04240 [Candidatus Woesearchaeota archaeon]|nr:hypothetical protein [Candidatus Woesearchaeota archaeon]
MTYYSHKYKPVDSARTKYLLNREKSLIDFRNRIPDKTIEKVRLPWGFYGYTYIGHNKAWLNDRLDEKPEQKERTDYHEVIHPPDEYEAIILTELAVDIDEEKLRIKIDNSYKYN